MRFFFRFSRQRSSHWSVLLLVAFAIAACAHPLQADQSVAYTSSTSQNSANRHFVVQVTSTSDVALLCQAHYSGKSFQNTTREGTWQLIVPAPGKQATQVVHSLEFEGFRTFTATVTCAARAEESR